MSTLLIKYITQVCSKMLDKFYPSLLLLPELDVSILTGGDQEVCPAQEHGDEDNDIHRGRLGVTHFELSTCVMTSLCM